MVINYIPYSIIISAALLDRVANSAPPGQLNREKYFFPLPPFEPQNLASRDRFGHLFPLPPFEPQNLASRDRFGHLFPLSPFEPQNLVSRDRFGRPVPRRHTPHSPPHCFALILPTTWAVNQVLTHHNTWTYNGGFIPLFSVTASSINSLMIMILTSTNAIHHHHRGSPEVIRSPRSYVPAMMAFITTLPETWLVVLRIVPVTNEWVLRFQLLPRYHHDMEDYHKTKQY